MKRSDTSKPVSRRHTGLGMALGALFALLAALILLAVTRFSVFSLLVGPTPLETITQSEVGIYTTKNIDYILDFYAEEAEDDVVTAWYAVVPQGDMLVTYLLPASYFDAAETVLYDTYAWLNGQLESRNQYFTVTGTVDRLDPAAEELLYQWFSETNGWLRTAGVIGESEDFADHLSPYVVLVGQAGGLPVGAVWALSAAALLCLAFAVFAALHLARGKRSAAAAARDLDSREVPGK